MSESPSSRCAIRPHQLSDVVPFLDLIALAFLPCLLRRFYEALQASHTAYCLIAFFLAGALNRHRPMALCEERKLILMYR